MKSLLHFLVHFFSTLHTSKNISDQDINIYLHNIQCETLTNEEQKDCDTIPTLLECRESLIT